jgi:hypothetical protein
MKRASVKHKNSELPFLSWSHDLPVKFLFKKKGLGAASTVNQTAIRGLVTNSIP